MILAPLYLRPIILLHRAFDFHLRAIEDCGGAADLQADFLHVRIVLNVFRFTGGYGRSVVFRCARLRVADLSVGRLEARTH